MANKEPGQEKKAYQVKIDAQLKKWDAEIKSLKGKADRSLSELKKRYGRENETLREKQRAAKEKLQGLKRSGVGNWRKLRAGVDAAISDMKKNLAKAAAKKKQGPP